MNIPNLLTIIRIVLVPFIGYFFFLDGKENLTIAIILFLLAGLTDILDGWIARKYDMITKLGKVLDPFADKLFQFTIALVLALKDIIPIWVIVVILVKEIFMGVGVLLLYKKQDIVTGSFWYGKFATVAIYCAIFFIVILGLEKPISTVVITVGVLPLIYAFYRYVKLFIELSVSENSKAE